MAIDCNTESEVVITIPKFRLETEFGFSGIYKELGIESAGADLSNITVSSKPMSMANFMTKQKTVFVLDEDGAEAASATGSSDITLNPTQFRFTADRPFVYMIREKSSGVILFIGAYVK